MATVEIVTISDSRLAVGQALQLTATAKDGSGRVLAGATITWTSSDSDRGEVDATGRVTGTGAGSVTITATADSATASIGLTVIDANLSGIGAAADDAFLAGLVQGLSGAIAPGMNQAIALCRTGATEGNFVKLDDCLARAWTLISALTDPTDSALGASESLFLNYIEREKTVVTQAQQGGNTK